MYTDPARVESARVVSARAGVLGTSGNRRSGLPAVSTRRTAQALTANPRLRATGVAVMTGSRCRMEVKGAGGQVT